MEASGKAGSRSERGGYVEAPNCGGPCLSFVSLGYEDEREGHKAKRMDMCGNPWKEVRSTSLWFILAARISPETTDATTILHNSQNAGFHQIFHS